MTLKLNRLYMRKPFIIKRCVEDQKQIFLDRIYALDNPFFISFFEQSAESIVADAYEFFVEAGGESNVFRLNISVMNKERGRRLFKLMSAYHTIRFLTKHSKNINKDEMSEALFTAFDFNDKEKRLFELLYTCANKFSNEFQRCFNSALCRYVLGGEVKNPIMLAYVDNFCYTSYYNFMLYFNKYIRIRDRFKKMG